MSFFTNNFLLLSFLNVIFFISIYLSFFKFEGYANYFFVNYYIHYNLIKYFRLYEPKIIFYLFGLYNLKNAYNALKLCIWGIPRFRLGNLNQSNT